MKSILTSFLIAPTFALFAQESKSISGNITSIDNKGIADVVVYVFDKDTTLITTAFSEEDGKYVCELNKSTPFFIRYSHPSYDVLSTELFSTETLNLPTVILQLKTTGLDEVAIVASKPYVERQAGKLVVNVEQSITSAGTSAFDVLEKSPGVSISSTDNISLNGKGGVMVQINGKNQPMSGTDLANYLRGIPSNSIEKIELISNPSAKYDAAGTAIINIILKKDTRLGTNGSVSGSFGHGFYPKSNLGISLNHRTKKVNVYGSYNYAYRKAFNHLVLERRFYQNDTFQGAYLQDNYLVFPFKTNIARLGADFDLNKKNSISIGLTGINNSFNPKCINQSDVLDASNIQIGTFETTNDSKDKWYNASANLNFTHKLDSLGSTWSTDADYARYGNQTNQLFTTNYYDNNHQATQNAYLLYGDLGGDLVIHSLKTDFHKVLKKEKSLDFGAKSSYVIADNNLKFYDRSSGMNVYDSTKSNHYIYQEYINAAYATANAKYGKWTVQLGLRAEHTHIIGEQRVYNSSYDTSYLQLFPTAFVSYALNDKNSFEISYNRRIDRPSYDQLNPFKFYLDPTTYKEGNPFLKPQTTHSLDLGYLLNQTTYFSAGFSRTVNNITEIIAPTPTASNVTVQTNINLAQVDILYFNISAPLKIKSWWQSMNSLNSYVALYSGNAAKTQLNNRGNGAFSVSTSNTFQLKKDWAIEVNGNYQSPQLYAFDKIKEIWSTGFGVQKKILDRKGVIKLAITDIFFTNNIRADVAFTDYKEYFDVKRETRVGTISFTYQFGKANGNATRKRGGAEDLKSRVNPGLG